MRARVSRMPSPSKSSARELMLFDIEPAPPPKAALYARVALNRPVDLEFTYSVPDELVARVVPGVRVAVPFGPQREIGVVTAIATESTHDAHKTKAIAKLLDDVPLLGAELLELTQWIARRYACSWGE